MKEQENITDLTYQMGSLLTAVYVLNHTKKYMKFRSLVEKEMWAKRTEAIRQKAYRVKKKIRGKKY
ncbi:hypothetical protein HYW46_04830 [Candidatus Daviesbacteria bacterium]|nr:hypothetical protein [Candidatus Daviesbacteria bacterium]